MEYIFETEHLRVRKFEMEDARCLYENHLEEEVKRWIPNESYADMEETQGAIKFYVDCVNGKHLPYVLAVELKETGELIGDTGVNEVEGNSNEVEIGYGICKKYSGNGYATELLKAMTEFIARTFGINILYGRVMHGNNASVRVLEKSGYEFVKEEFGAEDDPYGNGMLIYKKFAEVSMDGFVDERDYKILENDKYTFFVLGRIMGGKCELLLTDHEKLIICFTNHPYPVWIWTPDKASEEDMERAYRLAAEHSLLDGKHHFNLKYDLAHYFIQRAAAEGKSLSISLNMYAYDCRVLVEPTVIADGSIHRCSGEDLEELVDFIDRFHQETGIDQKDREDYRPEAEKFIKTGNMYFWKDKHGNNVACCKFAPNGNMASINLVFTRPAFRRKHYAENLVYQVTKLAMDAGYIPMLYTDADYTASNSCYEKIGYVLRGKLCTVG